MINAIHDENRVKVWLGVLFSDPTRTIPIAVDPINGGVKVNTTDVIAFTPSEVAIRDEDWHAVMMGEDENGNPCPVFVDASGAILIDN